MRTAHFALLAFTGHAAAQHVHMYIPEVESYIASVRSQFAPYTQGPRPETVAWGSRTSASATTTPTPVPSTNACSFWMENIAHQGIAAFNADPSNYTVFRNVKDYGAKGR